MFGNDGLIEKPNTPRVSQAAWGGAPYGTANTPAVTFQGLAARNQQYYNIGQPTGGMPLDTVNLACHHVVGWDVLWEFWNALIKNGDYLVARSLLAVHGVPQPTTANL